MAYQFCREGYKTVLIDKRDIATGSTAASTAMLQYEIDEPLHRLMKKVGEDAAIDSYRAGVEAIRKIERVIKSIQACCGFKKNKSLYIASSERDYNWLHQEFQCRRKLKFDVRWLSAREIKKQYGISGFGAIHSSAGAYLDAYALAHALVSYCVQHYGLQVFDHSRAEAVVYNHKENTVVTDNQTQIKCNYILYATGYETQYMMTEKIVDLNSTYAFISEPVANIRPSLKSTLLWNTDDPYVYMRTTPDNRIVVGGGDEGFKNPLIRDSLIEAKEEYLLNRIRVLLPDLDLIPDFSWAGTFGVTKDALPYIGPHPDYPNSYFMLGFGGNGITFSIMGMKILSDAIAGRPNKFAEYYRFNR